MSRILSQKGDFIGHPSVQPKNLPYISQRIIKAVETDYMQNDWADLHFLET